tara:strand:+ start:19169 stop:19321 length:153 start_codon:yes stop_codon:yes gene_type:complete
MMSVLQYTSEQLDDIFASAATVGAIDEANTTPTNITEPKSFLFIFIFLDY